MKNDNNEALNFLSEKGLEGIGRLYSIYRAVVVNNEDQAGCNRLKVSIPGAYGGMTLWANPRNQHGSFGTNLEGKNYGNGFKHILPKIGDVVFVSFELGDPSLPLWEYHGWSSNQVPPELQGEDTFGFVTPNGNKVIFSENENSMDILMYGDCSIYSKGNVNLMADGNVNILAGEDHHTIIQLNNDRIILKLNETTIESTNDGVVINGGKNGGSINVVELTNKLNSLVDEVNKLRNMLNTHTHTSANPGSPTSISTVQMTSPVSQFNKSDYEDSKCKH